MSSLAQKRNALGRGQVPSNYVPGTAACRRCAVRRRGVPGRMLARSPLPPCVPPGCRGSGSGRAGGVHARAVPHRTQLSARAMR